MLNAFLPVGGKKHGDYGIGYAIRSEGFTSLEDIIKRLKLEAGDARQLMDRPLSHQCDETRLLLNCARCRWEAFYRIDHVGPTFTCQACEHVSPLTHGRWYKEDPEPHIYYALDQVVRNLLSQHGYLPILAAAQLGKDARSVLWTSEFSVVTDDDSIELDLCLIVDGRIIVGEAKSNGILKAEHGTQEAAKRLVQAAHILTADEIILATSKERWAAGTYELVMKAIGTHWERGPKPRLRELVNVVQAAKKERYQRLCRQKLRRERLLQLDLGSATFGSCLTTSTDRPASCEHTRSVGVIGTVAAALSVEDASLLLICLGAHDIHRPPRWHPTVGSRTAAVLGAPFATPLAAATAGCHLWRVSVTGRHPRTDRR